MNFPKKFLTAVGTSACILAGSVTASLAEGDYWFPHSAHFYDLYSHFPTCEREYGGIGKYCYAIGTYCGIEYFAEESIVDLAKRKWAAGQDVAIHQNWGSEELACRVSP